MKQETKLTLELSLIVLALWLLPPPIFTYALLNWTTIYRYSGYSFNEVLLAIWAVWTFVAGIFGWLINNYREGQEIGAVVAQDIIEERELRRKMLDKLEREEPEPEDDS